MAWLYENGKKYRVKNLLDSKDNPTLYVETRPGYQKKVSGLIINGRELDPNVFKAVRAFKAERPQRIKTLQESHQKKKVFETKYPGLRRLSHKGKRLQRFPFAYSLSKDINKF